VKTNKGREPAKNSFIHRAKKTLASLELLPEKLEGVAETIRESAQVRCKDRLHEIQNSHAANVQNTKNQYEGVLSSVQKRIDETTDNFDYPQRCWSDKTWDNFRPPDKFSHHQIIRVGTVKKTDTYQQVEIPWLLPLLGHNNVLIKASGRSKDNALGLLQTIILRLLASLPAGRLRITFIDPVSYGKVFGGFMNLSEIIKGENVWREKNHIHEQLLDLSELIAFVNQNFLKNDFESFEGYNRHVQEIEEPYRLLVISNFPVGFDRESANRLVSITENGNRTGVYTLVMVDTDKKCPYDFDVKDLEKRCLNIGYDSRGQPFWENSLLPACRYIQDPLPNHKIFEGIISTISKASEDVNKVKVPFEATTKDIIEQLWEGKTSERMRIPIGKVGTDRQFLVLGESEHHALVGGRTSMGKSVFLHNLILTMCLYYPPDELELCLIDFKEGVEFMKYATHQLPHASVVAIETEREFGYSILQKLENELEKRAQLFKEAGSNITDLSHFNKKSLNKIPRIILILDEFQEFFTEDDSLARQTASIIDRLARQGRNFGINLILSSQTLTGQSNLLGSTKGQMPIRIAFECNDSDSRGILGDENPEAKFLTRPGEAIYNDKNGQIKGNNKFQVPWLSNEKIEKYLLQFQKMVKERGYKPPHPQIVFDGRIPGKISNNVPFYNNVKEKAWEKNPKKCIVWLGESIAIKPHTHAMFSRQSGSNLMFIGKGISKDVSKDISTDVSTDVSTIASMQLMCILSIAAQQSPEDASFYIVNFFGKDQECVELFSELNFMLDRHEVKLINRQNELPEMISDLHSILSDRLAMDEGPQRPSIYLFFMGLQRARILRKQGYDLSEGSKKLVQIFQDGPDVGIHSIIWSDVYRNFVRAFDRALNHFDMRVLLHVNADDSNVLIDSSIAANLKPLQAFYFDGDRPNSLEKFKPYELIDKPTLDGILRHIREKEIQL